jgi:hypothetical protein
MLVGNGIETRLKRTDRGLNGESDIGPNRPDFRPKAPPFLLARTFAFTQDCPLRTLVAMWYVEEKFDSGKIEVLSSEGFTVRSTGGVVRLEKFGCGAELRKMPDGRYQMTELPAVMKLGQFTRLWDAGYQKFLLSSEGRKFPAAVQDLSNLRRFNEELRSALGVPTYYNEALGSTCHVSVYDRVKGRPGDVPDETVGAKSGQED